MPATVENEVRRDERPEQFLEQQEMKEITQGVAELLVLVALITGLDHDGLSAGESAGEDDNNLDVLEAVSKVEGEGSVNKFRCVGQLRRHT